jgi:hypothetical protein
MWLKWGKLCLLRGKYTKDLDKIQESCKKFEKTLTQIQMTLDWLKPVKRLTRPYYYEKTILSTSLRHWFGCLYRTRPIYPRQCGGAPMHKFLGWRKIVRTDDSPWDVQKKHQDHNYAGTAWANEIAKRGYAVLVHDTFPFASRRVRVADVEPRLKGTGVDPEPNDAEGIAKYNAFAGQHEHIMEKSLLSAGTTWPGVYLVEDQKALDVLCSRPGVNPARVGCAGLSGGGMRTVFLAGLDDRIKGAVAVGFMTTWKDFVLNKSFTHTWMVYVPLLPNELDFPEILGLREPQATLVLNDEDDYLYTLPEMKQADKILSEVYKKANAGNHYKCSFYPGPHKFDKKMQEEAFDWFDKWLNP